MGSSGSGSLRDEASECLIVLMPGRGFEILSPASCHHYWMLCETDCNENLSVPPYSVQVTVVVASLVRSRSAPPPRALAKRQFAAMALAVKRKICLQR